MASPLYIWLVLIGLAPETNLEKAFADMVVDAVMDIRAKIRKCRFETDATLKVFILINVWGCQWGIAVVSKQLKIFYLVSKQLKKCKQQKNV